MKLVFLIISCWSFFFIGISQEQPNLLSPTKVTTIGYWTKGEKKSYHVTETEVTMVGTSSSPSTKTSREYDFEIVVVDSSEHNYVLELKYLSTNSGSSDPQLDKVMNSLLTGTAVRYQTDEFGAFVKIANTTILQKEFQKKLEVLRKELTANKTANDVKEITKFLDDLKVQFSNPENIEVLYLDDILELHGLYGTEVNLNKTEDVELEIPCLMDIVLKSTGKLMLQSVNKTKDIAVISLKSKPNPNEIQRYLKPFFNAFVPKEMTDIKLEDFKIAFEDVQKLTMLLSSGWMQTVQTTRTIDVSYAKEKVKKINTTTYQLK